MSGLSAFLRLSDRAPALDRDELRHVLDALAQRGTAIEQWWHARRHVALASRAGESAHQLAVSRSTGSAVVLDGRLLDRAALAASYEARGLGAPDGSNSAQLLLDLLELRGERALHDLRGAFAFAYWDERRRALLLARDGFGARPLYYGEHDGVLCVASTVRALEASGALPLDRDPAAEVGFLLTGSVPEPFTWRRSIRALPAGHFLWIGAGNGAGSGTLHEPRAWVRIERELVRAVEATDEDAVAPELDAPGPIATSCDLVAAAAEAVDAHLVREADASERAVACLVSGSVASRAAFALVAQRVAAPVRAVHLDVHLDAAFGGSFDARPTELGSGAAAVREVAGRSGADAVDARLAEDAFLAEWSRLAQQMDQPSLGGLVTYFACKAARENGCERAVVGHGAALLLDDARGAVERPFARGAAVFERDELAGVLGVERARDGLAALDAALAEQRAQLPDTSDDPGLTRVVALLDRLRGGRLRDVDWAAAAHGVEAIAPFCDVELWRRAGATVVRRARALEPSAVLEASASSDDARDVLGAWAVGAHRREQHRDRRRTDANAAAAWTRTLARTFVEQEAA